MMLKNILLIDDKLWMNTTLPGPYGVISNGIFFYMSKRKHGDFAQKLTVFYGACEQHITNTYKTFDR